MPKAVFSKDFPLKDLLARETSQQSLSDRVYDEAWRALHEAQPDLHDALIARPGYEVETAQSVHCLEPGSPDPADFVLRVTIWDNETACDEPCFRTIPDPAELQEEIESLEEEIQDAHETLTQCGVWKEHWSLSGRVRLLSFVTQTTELNEKARQFVLAVKQMLEEIRKAQGSLGPKSEQLLDMAQNILTWQYPPQPEYDNPATLVKLPDGLRVELTIKGQLVSLTLAEAHAALMSLASVASIEEPA